MCALSIRHQGHACQDIIAILLWRANEQECEVPAPLLGKFRCGSDCLIVVEPQVLRFRLTTCDGAI